MKLSNSDSPMKLLVIANWAQGIGFSGGDRIFIELARRWSDKAGLTIHLLLSEEGWEFCEKKGLNKIDHTIWSPGWWTRLGLFPNFWLRTFHSLSRAVRLPLDESNLYVYSTSDFWPDALPALVLKLMRRETKWIAGFYLFAPKPWAAESPYKGKRYLRGWFYWLTQQLVYGLVRRFADKIFAIGEFDRQRLLADGVATERIVVVRGGVDVDLSASVAEPPTKTYDAVFIGRLHLQKGGSELIDIWREVVKTKPEARLIMIGDHGPLEEEIETKIKRYDLNDNITLVHLLSDLEKVKVYKSSRVVVHPAVYDVGGMAACEAMVCGLPGVSFDLPGLRKYYPIGMLKAPSQDFRSFARCILQLLEDRSLYEQVRQDALKLAYSWDWKQRADELLEAMLKPNGDSI